MTSVPKNGDAVTFTDGGNVYDGICNGEPLPDCGPTRAHPKCLGEPLCGLPVQPFSRQVKGGRMTELNSRGTPVREKTSVEVAQFTDKYGEQQVIHRTHNGLRVRYGRTTPILKLNPHIARCMGERITALRTARGLTLEQLANACGMVSGHPKNRMWEIEKGTRGDGIRLGTLYAVAIALGVEAWEILPTTDQVRRLAEREGIEVPNPT